MIQFEKIDWSNIEKVEHKGETGISTWQTREFEKIRIRIVEYSKGYLADHWCEKGHIVHCLEGDFMTELRSGEKIKLSKGESFIVSDDMSSHRSYSENGVKLFIVDGQILGLPLSAPNY